MARDFFELSRIKMNLHWGTGSHSDWPMIWTGASCKIFTRRNRCKTQRPLYVWLVLMTIKSGPAHLRLNWKEINWWFVNPNKMQIWWTVELHILQFELRSHHVSVSIPKRSYPWVGILQEKLANTQLSCSQAVPIKHWMGDSVNYYKEMDTTVWCHMWGDLSILNQG